MKPEDKSFNEEAAGKQTTLPTRRDFVKTAAVAAASLAAASLVPSARAFSSSARTIKVGLVSPRTGPISAFAAADDFVIAGVRKAIGDSVVVNGVRHPIEIIMKDSQSNPNRAAEVASSLIKSDQVDLLIASYASETVNPVSDQAEINGVPCITSCCPWQAYFFGRGGKPDKGFDWTYHFCWGLEDVIVSYLSMWHGLPTNKVIGGLWGNDGDGNAFADRERGLPPAILANGFKLVDPGRFNPMTNDFSAQISMFKQADAQILTGNLPPSAFSTFWSQAAQQGYRPKICTMAKALLFPSTLDALGDRGNNLTTELWWNPHYPFKSSLTGQSPAEFAAQWEKETGKQWTQPMGFQHSLLEVTIDTLRRTKNIDKPESILEAIRTTKLDTIMGSIQWTGQPVKNICRTPLVGGQWVRTPGKKFMYDLLVVNNENNKRISAQVPMKPVGYAG
jgi:branched-chain amino acid transport system substrate-binding protein